MISLVTDEAKFLKIFFANLGPTGLNQAQMFGSLASFSIACNDSLQQCLTFSRGKNHEKKLEA